MENNRDVILQAKDLRISFTTINGTVKAVRGVNFELYRGRTLGIVGESGSGKSVSSRAVMGILAGNRIIEGGQILYNGLDLLSLSEEDFCKLRGRKISMIFQDPLSSLNPIMKVGNQLTETMFLKEKSTIKEGKEIVELFLKEFEKYADKKLIKETFEHYQTRYFDEAESERVFGAYQTFIDRINLMLSTIVVNEVAYRDTVFVQQLKEIKFLINDIKNKFHLKEESPFDKVNCLDLDVFVSNLLKNENKDREEKVYTLMECYKHLLNIAKTKFSHKLLPVVVAEIRSVLSSMIKTLEVYKENHKLVYRVELTKEDEELYEKVFKEAVTNEGLRFKEGEKLGIEGLKEVHSRFFGDGVNFDGNAFKKAIPQITQLIIDSTYKLARDKDTLLLTIPGSLKSLIENYFVLVKRETKQAKLEAKGNLKTQDKAFMSEIDDGSLICVEKIKQLLLNAINHLESIKDQPFNNDEALEVAKSYLKSSYKDILPYINIVKANMKAISLLREVGIPEPEKRIKQYPFEFSGGMRQRIVIAIALSSNPEILICDEPTTALDVTIQSQILELINKLKLEKNLSIIFITHDLGVIANIADDIAVMYAGKIVEYGTCQDVFYNPKHPYTWALLSSMPDLNTKEKLDAIAGTPPNMILPPKGDAFAARNKYALEIDFEEQPPMIKVSDTHYAATWLLDERAPEAVPPKVVIARIQKAYDDMKQAGTLEGPILDNPFIKK